jgi:uncharacterized protein (DUF983 family)
VALTVERHCAHCGSSRHVATPPHSVVTKVMVVVVVVVVDVVVDKVAAARLALWARVIAVIRLGESADVAATGLVRAHVAASSTATLVAAFATPSSHLHAAVHGCVGHPAARVTHTSESDLPVPSCARASPPPAHRKYPGQTILRWVGTAHDPTSGKGLVGGWVVWLPITENTSRIG